jgi:hypothetical protein
LEDARDLAPATVARRITTVCGFYRHCTAEGVIDRDPGQFVRRPHVPTESRTLGLTYLEFVSFLHAAAAIGPEANGLANLLGMLGLRVSEACGVDIGDLGEERGHRVVRVIGKGRKPATIPLPVPVARSLDAARGDREAGPLLQSRTGRRLDRHAAARLVTKTCRAAGISKRISPHSLRHTYVTQLLDAGPRSATFSSAPDTPTRGSRCGTTEHDSSSTGTSTTSSPPALPVPSDSWLNLRVVNGNPPKPAKRVSRYNGVCGKGCAELTTIVVTRDARRVTLPKIVL